MPVPANFVSYSAVLQRLRRALKADTVPPPVASPGASPVPSAAQGAASAPAPAPAPGAASPKKMPPKTRDRSQAIANLRTAHAALKQQSPERDFIGNLHRQIDDVHILTDARGELHLTVDEFVNADRLADKFETSDDGKLDGEPGDALMRASTAATLASSRPRTVALASGEVRRFNAKLLPISVLADLVKTPTLSEALRLMRGLVRELADLALAAQITAVLSLAVVAVQKETNAISRWVPGKSDLELMSNAPDVQPTTNAFIRKSLSRILLLANTQSQDQRLADSLVRFLLAKELRVEDPVEMALRFLMETSGSPGTRQKASETLATLLNNPSNKQLKRILGACEEHDYLPLAVVRRDELNAESNKQAEMEKLGNLPAVFSVLMRKLNISKAKTHTILALADDFSDVANPVTLALMTLDE